MRDEDSYDRRLLPHFSEILLICLEKELGMLHDPVERAVQQRLLHIWDDVRNNPAHQWSVRELAGYAGMAIHHFSAVCKRHTGIPPMQKVTMIRMEMARHLLLATSMTLREIATRVGYKTEYAFSDAFKRVTGTRPGAIRCELS